MVVSHTWVSDRHSSPVRALRWLPAGPERGRDRLV
jgi:hypothetical protein